MKNLLQRLGAAFCGRERPHAMRSGFVDILSQSASFDSPVDRCFHGKPFHRAEDIGPFNVDAMVRDLGGKLLRSRRDFMVVPSGVSRRLYWSNLLFALDAGAFAYVQLKSPSYGNDLPVDEIYRVMVTAATPERALKEMERLRERYRPRVADTGAGFFILADDSGFIDRASLPMEHRLSQELLALHYGDAFVTWSQDFLAGLASPGLSILRGDPGTGKTSFLRHAMCMLGDTHRFYFVPVDSFGILASGSLIAFWKRQQRDYPLSAKVLVLEDAEALLAQRDCEHRGAVSTLLNLTDGLMGELVCVHLICTLNCKEDALDPALLRPGRLRFCRHFSRLPFDQATRVATHHCLTLSEQKDDYSLAEIFASPDFTGRSEDPSKARARIGF